MYRRSITDELGDTAAGIVVAILVAGLVIFGIFMKGMLTEIFRIYRAWAFQPTTTARILWVALIVLLLIWLMAGLMAFIPYLGVLATYVSSWAFLLYCLVVEACDWYAQRQEQELLGANSAGLLELSPSAAGGHGNQAFDWTDVVREGVVLGENAPVD
jgi:hypothetical protein